MIFDHCIRTICKGTEPVNNERLMITIICADSKVFYQIHFSCSVGTYSFSFLGNQSVAYFEDILFLIFVYPKDLGIKDVQR